MATSKRICPRRICIVTDAWHPQVNGVVRTYQHLRVELEALGHHVLVIGPGDMPRAVPMPGYAEIRLALPPYTRLRRLIDDFQPDSLHLATEGPLGWAARRYALRHGRRFSTAYHTQFPAYVARRVTPPLKRTAFALADRFIRRFHAPTAVTITTTPSIDAELRARGYTGRLASLPRGVPTDLFRPGDSSAFADLPRPRALFVGRVAPEKNIEDFLRMAWPGGKIVVGDGPARAALEQAHPDIRFTGKMEGAALADAYRAADIFVFPSLTDTFGIVILEALASGLPVAAYPVAGPRDILTAPFLGALDDDLAIAAETALGLRGQAAARAAYMRDHYTWSAIARDFLKILADADA